MVAFPRDNDEIVDVVYDLCPSMQELYFIDAYIVTKDKSGLPAHIRQKATSATIGAFQLEMDANRQLLFRLIEEVQEDVIIKKFHRTKRKAPSLEQLLEDREVLKAVQRYVHQRVDVFLRTIVKEELPLCLSVDRRLLVKDFLVDTRVQTLEPRLYFRKDAASVEYRLNLFLDNKPWPLLGRDVTALTNNPGWLVADNRLFQLQHINGYLVKPFRQREAVSIPATSVKAYFQQFILKIVNKVDVEAEGFSVIQFNTLDACELRPVQQLFSDQWVIAVDMAYKDTRFGWKESRQKRTTLNMEGDEVEILQVSRNGAAEQKAITKLSEFPLVELDNGGYFSLSDDTADHPKMLLKWLADNRESLQEQGFTLIEPELDGRTLSLQPARLDMEVQRHNDWFDLHGEVLVGSFRFPFVQLARHIRQNDPWFALPDGTWFLIPEEWMNKYKQLADFGQASGQHLRIAKSQYTLLDAVAAPHEVPQLDTEIAEYVPSTQLQYGLRPYQMEGVRWLVKHHNQGLGACLADDMGLGKTFQTIALLLYAKEQKAAKNKTNPASPAPAAKAGSGQLALFQPADDTDFLQPLNALIVMPASLLYNWESELRKFAPSMSVYQHFGPKRHTDLRVLARFDVILTTYQTALRDVETLRKLPLEYIVLDESQQIKNRDSKVFKALNSLNGAHKLSLSGTPIENSLSDLWSQMQFINEGLLGSFPFFREAFINPIERQQDEEQKEKLRKLVGPYLLRRTKEEVAKDLPELTTQVFFSDMLPEQRKIYEKEKSAARNYLLDHFNASSAQYRIMVVQTLTKLRQLANHPALVDSELGKNSGKFTDVMEQWETVQRGGHKVLFFSSFVQHLALFEQAFEQKNTPFAKLTGDMDAKSRKRAIDQFQEDEATKAFFISIKAGGAGLNLTAADYVFILDPWWNPSTEQQAIARAHRIGQDKKVFATKFIAKDTIEEKIVTLQLKKSQLAADILENSTKLSLAPRDLDYLLS